MSAHLHSSVHPSSCPFSFYPTAWPPSHFQVRTLIPLFMWLPILLSLCRPASTHSSFFLTAMYPICLSSTCLFIQCPIHQSLCSCSFSPYPSSQLSIHPPPGPPCTPSQRHHLSIPLPFHPAIQIWQLKACETLCLTQELLTCYVISHMEIQPSGHTTQRKFMQCLCSLGTRQGAWPLLPAPASTKLITLQPVMCVHNGEPNTVAVTLVPGAAVLAPQSVGPGLQLEAAPQGFTEPYLSPTRASPLSALCPDSQAKKRDFIKKIPAWVPEPVAPMSLTCTSHCYYKLPHPCSSA